MDIPAVDKEAVRNLDPVKVGKMLLSGLQQVLYES